MSELLRGIVHSPVTLIRAPCNLGLRPLRDGHVPGTWRAPEALKKAGLDDAIGPAAVIEMPRPAYSPGPQPGTRLRNGPALRAFNLELADHVEQVVASGGFPLVVGGDCSILLGALAGARRHGPTSLVHVDGHSDFRHPGNYDPQAMLGAVAGMDLALATGRGEPLMTEWPSIDGALVADRNVVQIGERECFDPDFAWPDINETKIKRIDVFEARRIGVSGILQETMKRLDDAGFPFWIHLDVDVLDQELMPAVDSPGSPGIDPDQLAAILGSLLCDRRSLGLTLTVFDPELDPQGDYALLIASLIAQALSGS